MTTNGAGPSVYCYEPCNYLTQTIYAVTLKEMTRKNVRKKFFLTLKKKLMPSEKREML